MRARPHGSAPRSRRALVLALLAQIGATIGACSQSGGELVGTDHSANTGALGFCRSTTCEHWLPAGYPTAEGICQPADFSDSDACRSHRASNAPLWWRTSCAGYDLNASASRNVSYDVFAQATEGAFAAWTSATCPMTTGAPLRTSIDVRNLGPVSCASAAYDKTGGPNQNVIVFHDDAWPYEAKDRAAAHASKSTVIALTTVTFDPKSGEIYDADVELNSADYTIAPLASAPTGGESFDLQSILTHELGHFFGLAHSPSPDAVMNASGDSDTSSSKRALRPEDVRGICAIYPADRTRSVSTIVDPRGTTAAGACDPTPRHGFRSDCP